VVCEVDNVSLILTLKSKRGERGMGNGEEKIENSGRGRGKREERRVKRWEIKKLPYPRYDGFLLLKEETKKITDNKEE
jgi:hypothetical protein